MSVLKWSPNIKSLRIYSKKNWAQTQMTWILTVAQFLILKLLCTVWFGESELLSSLVISQSNKRYICCWIYWDSFILLKIANIYQVLMLFTDVLNILTFHSGPVLQILPNDRKRNWDTWKESICSSLLLWNFSF